MIRKPVKTDPEKTGRVKAPVIKSGPTLASGLTRKTLLCSGAIVLCNIALLLIIIIVQNQYEEELRQDRVAQIVVSSITEFSAALEEATAGMIEQTRFADITQQDFAALLGKASEYIDKLKPLLKDKPLEVARLEAVTEAMQQAIILERKFVRKSARVSKVEPLDLAGNRYATDMIDLTDTILVRLDELDDKYREIERKGEFLTSQHSEILLSTLLFIGILANSAISITIFLYFTNDLAVRISEIGLTGEKKSAFDPKHAASSNFDEVESLESTFREFAHNIHTATSRATLILEHAANFICLVDHKGIIVSVSEPSATILGYSPDQLIGRRLNSILSGEAVEILNQAVRNNAVSVINFESPVIMGSGGRREFAFRITTGQRQGLVCIANDVTEENKVRAQIKASEERFRTILDTLPLMVLGLSPAGNINSVNRTGVSLSQFNESEIIGQPLGEMLADSDRPAITQSQSDAVQARGLKLQQRLVRKDGSSIPVSVHICTCAEKGQQGASKTLACLRDLSIQEEIESAKRDFVNMIGHDLRSPLMSLHTSLAIIAKETGLPTVAKGESILQNLIALTTNFLDLGKLEAGEQKLTQAKTSVVSLFRSTVDAISESPQTRDLDLMLTHPAYDFTAEVDSARLAEAIIHLLSVLNAAGSPDSTYRLEFKHAQEDLLIHVGGDMQRQQISFSDNLYSESSAAQETMSLRNKLSLGLARAILNLHQADLKLYQEGERQGFYIRMAAED